jgi:hypothetical protein
MPEGVERISGGDREFKLLTGLVVDDPNGDAIRVLIPQESHGEAVALAMIELA